MPTKNFDRLHRVLDYIKGHPETWHQDHWITRWTDEEWKADEEAKLGRHLCGTTACFAGRAALMFRPDLPWFRPVEVGGPDLPHSFADLFSPTSKRRRTTMREVATAELGLDQEEAELLFAGTNTLAEIEGLIEAWEGAQ
jgi:hypothetical protein